MCFSASASFTASILLLALARAAYQKTVNKSQILLASIPLLFAIQQACEGFLWLTFAYPQLASIKPFLTYSFLFFAFIVWPILIPTATWLMEPTNIKYKLFYSFIGIGFLVSATLATFLFYYPVSATIEHAHINYAFNISAHFYLIGMISYLCAVIPPMFFSSIHSIKILGLLITASYLLSCFFYLYAFTSVWCFFVAILSAYIIIIIDAVNEK